MLIPVPVSGCASTAVVVLDGVSDFGVGDIFGVLRVGVLVLAGLDICLRLDVSIELQNPF